VFEQFEEQEAVKKSAMIEKNGFAFYSQLIEKFSDAKILEILKKLRDDEKKHLETIENRYFKEVGFGDTITEEEVEVELYVEAKGVPDLFTRNIDMKKLIASIDSLFRRGSSYLHLTCQRRKKPRRTNQGNTGIDLNLPDQYRNQKAPVA